MSKPTENSRFGIGTLLVIAMSLAVLPVGLVATFQAWQDVNRIHELERLAFNAEAEKALFPIRERLDETYGTTGTLSALASGASGNPGVCSRLMSQAVNRDEMLIYAGILLDNRQIVCSSNEADGPEVLSADLFDALATTGRSNSFQGVELVTGGSIHVSRPIVMPTGDQRWFVTVWSDALLELDPNSDLITDLVIVDRYGSIHSSTEEGRFPVGIDFATLRDAAGDIFRTRAADGSEMLYSVAPVAGRSLLVLAGASSDQNPVLGGSARFWPLVLPMLMWAASLIVAVTASNRLAVKPLKALEKMTRAVRLGVRDIQPLQLRDAPSEFQSVYEKFVEMSERIMNSETDLKRSLEQKTVLIKEVHHRVRNNLQLLVSILNMQERELEDVQTKTSLDRFRQRVLGLSAVYERIYDGDDFDQGVSSEVIKDIAALVAKSEHLSSRQVQYAVEDMVLAQEQAVPLAMLVSEAMAYLCARSSAVEITVAFSIDQEGLATFLASNAGTADKPTSSELPLRLLRAFALQLNGKMTMEDAQGRDSISVTFPVGTPA